LGFIGFIVLFSRDIYKRNVILERKICCELMAVLSGLRSLLKQKHCSHTEKFESQLSLVSYKNAPAPELHR
jgi:hypothetical protein